MAALPTPSRKSDIHAKLRYAEVRRNELALRVVRGYVEGFDPGYLGLLADDILANTRECFDYLAHDLVESYALPSASSQWQQQYELGRQKIYFPYFTSQIENWKKFPGITEGVIDKFRLLVAAMDDNLRVSDTLFYARDFRVIQSSVNSKKHVKVSVTRVSDDTLNLFEHAGIIILTKIRQDNRIWMSITGGSKEERERALDAIQGTEPRKVGEYRFEANGQNLNSLCLFAVRATMIIMDWWYEDFFAPTGSRINDYLPEHVDHADTPDFPRFRAQPGQNLTVTYTRAPPTPKLPWVFEPAK